jgi:GAF domain-containing protein
MARRTLAARGESLRLVPSWGDRFGVELAGEVLLPGPDAQIAPTTFETWLATQASPTTPAGPAASSTGSHLNGTLDTRIDQDAAGLVAGALARVAVMDWPTVLCGIDEVLASDRGRPEQAVQIAELVRQAGGYRWVGLYEVTEQEIAAVGWSGPGAPAHPRFAVTKGLSGAAVAARHTVVVNAVTADPRYLTAFASTLSEAIVPVLDPATGAVVGTLDVESGERDAFTDADRQALERVAAASRGLFA